MSKPTDTEALNHEQLTSDGVQSAIRTALASCHSADAHLTRYSYQNSVDVTALLELLVAKGVVGLTEWNQRRPLVEHQIAEQRAKEWTGPTLHPQKGPVPTQTVDCSERMDACAAACCRVYNVYLTAAEVMSGKYVWDLHHPYRLLRDEAGACAYLESETGQCSIWEERPSVCRGYSCKSESKIWSNFDEKVVAAEALEAKARAFSGKGQVE